MQHAQPTYRRALAASERLYLAGQHLVPPFTLQLFVEGDGDVDVDRLVAAVAAASEACPGARLRAVGKHWVDAGEAPPVRAVGAIRSLRIEDSPVLWSRLDPYDGPTCEVLVARGARTQLVFRAFHGVMDGRGLLLWVSEIFRALRGEPLLGAPSVETDLGLLARLGPPGRRNRIRFDCRSPLGDGKVDDLRYSLYRRTLQGSHPGLVAKIAAVLAATGGDRSRFMIPVDLRRHDAALRGTGNLSLPLYIEASCGDSWEALHERILGDLAERRDLATDAIDGALSVLPLWSIGASLGLAVRRQAAKQRYLCSALLSHLGRVELDTYSAPGFDAATVYSLPIHALLAPVSVVAIECPGHVELALACSHGDGVAERAEALLDRIEDAVAHDGARRWAANRTAAPYPADRTAIELFADQVARRPDAVALVAGAREVSYRALAQRAGAIAAALTARGVGPGAVVGLLADRTVDAVAAILGVLAAGAAYLPIDPQYPAERIGLLLGDAAAPLCLVERAHAATLAGVFAGPRLVLDEIEIADGAALPAAAATPSDLAYVIYTSGSTGRPKGVEIEHRSLVNYLAWAQRAYGVDASSRFALFTSLSFDLTVTALLLPLVSGGSVALYPGEIDHVALRAIVEQSGAIALKLTPTHLELISRLELAPAGFRVLVVGGEQLRGTVAARAQAMFGPGCRIVNEYGPTETTVGCVFHVYDAARDADLAAVPIGVPADNTRIALLDGQRRPVAVGETGEIFIAGDGLARGYRGRPDLSRDRFVRLADGSRAYRTGDLARIGDRGLLEYLGRGDDQIKIRGHRIEPGEVEAVLEQHPQIDRAVVLGRSRPGHDDKVLCAYVLRAAGGDVADDDLRRYLEDRLPRFLVPAFFLAVDTIPATVNGKVDVRALPDPFADLGGPADGAARDAVEAELVAIWSHILDVDPDRIGPDSDFHHLGGDSLRMVEMLSAVATRLVGDAGEDQFMRQVRPVLRRPTVATIRRAVEAARGEPT